MTTDRDAKPAAPEPRTGYSFALTVALVYAAFGALWILLSDTLLGWVLQDRELLMLVSTIKGWVFVFLSALLIFGVAVRFHRHEHPAVEHRSWRIRTPWMSMGVISLAIVGVSLVSVVQTWRQESAQMERLMRTTGVGMTERLLDWHKERLSTAHQVQHRAWVSDQWTQYARAPSPGQLERVTEALEIYLSSPDVTGVELYDAALVRLWLSGPSAGHHEPEAYRRGLQRVRASGEAGWVGPWRDDSGQTHLAYVGFLAPGTEVQALVVMHVNVTGYLADVLDEWPALESSGEAYWVSGTPDAPDGLTAWAGFPQGVERSGATALALARAAMAGDLATGVQTSVPGARQVGMALPLADTGWWIVLESGTQTLWANVLRRGGLFTLAGLLGIFSAFAVAYLVLQRRTIAMGERSLLRLQQSREELAQSESRYRLLAENARDTVWLLDVASQRLVYISPAVEHLVGYTPDELRQMSIEEMLMPQSLPVALQWLDDHVARFNAGDPTAAEGVLELFQRHRDGSAVAIEVSMRLVADEHGRAHQIQGVTRDISERHRSQHQIRMLSQATEQSPVSVIITNASGLIEYVNPAFERMSGYTTDEVLGRNPRMLQSSRTPRETYRRMWEALAQGRPWQGELINKRKGGGTLSAVGDHRPVAQRQAGSDSVHLGADGHHGPAGRRGTPGTAGVVRSPHGAAQPAAAAWRHRHGAGTTHAAPRAGRAHHHERRPFQGHQRRAGTRHR